MIYTELASDLACSLGAAYVRRNEPMSVHTTFCIGGMADLYVEPASVVQIQSVLSLCRQAGVPLHVIGRGSNLLVADTGLRGVVLRLGARFSDITVDGTDMFVRAGALNAQVGEQAALCGLSGFEFACGIPGTVGGAALMNAGAYGHEFKDVCAEVICLDGNGNKVTIPRSEAGWRYRHSMMEDEDLIVVGAHLVLQPASKDDIRARMRDLAQRRHTKQPLDLPSAGSTFKRPEGCFAAKLIDEAGLRGFTVGGAQVSTKHTGFVVNIGGATAADVRAVITTVQRRVKDAFGVDLSPEIRMWGFSEDT